MSLLRPARVGLGERRLLGCKSRQTAETRSICGTMDDLERSRNKTVTELGLRGGHEGRSISWRRTNQFSVTSKRTSVEEGEKSK
jgi:hypothetical protein